METKAKHGSEKLLAAWKARALSDDSVKEIAGALDKSPANVDSVRVFGGASATGLQVSLSYTGDDIPICGNDMQFWLNWLRRHGGQPRPPRVIINGIPFPEILRLELDFGHVPSEDLGAPELGDIAGGTILGQ